MYTPCKDTPRVVPVMMPKLLLSTWNSLWVMSHDWFLAFSSRRRDPQVIYGRLRIFSVRPMFHSGTRSFCRGEKGEASTFSCSYVRSSSRIGYGCTALNTQHTDSRGEWNPKLKQSQHGGRRNLGTGQTVAPGFVGSDRCVLSKLLQVMYSITTRTVIFP
jgi:hypothetical protein